MQTYTWLTHLCIESEFANLKSAEHIFIYYVLIVRFCIFSILIFLISMYDLYVTAGIDPSAGMD